MTRFARAKGSKSSNERAPEDSTPWEVMKEQLLQAKTDTEQAKNREEAEKQRIENYENFLKEHKVQKRKATWCDFPEAESKKPKDSPKKQKKSKQEVTNGAQSTMEDTSSEKIVTPKKKDTKKKKKKQKSEQTSYNQDQTAPEHSEQDVSENTVPKKNLKKKNVPHTEQSDGSNPNGQQVDSTQNKNKKNKKNKKQSVSLEVPHHEQNKNVNGNQNTNQIKKKKNKLVDGAPVRRKPIDDRAFQLIINGKEVELIRFDGFPIMKKDAERLQELKSNMIKKGIPKSEVNRTLKLERRRAEKALARLKRDVCYNCRKGGHNLSDCPELKSKIPGVGAADGVCFKCGSTEHKQFECKVQKDKEFRFATCFICKEPGHIARQCPDNPKGLYPNGGGCKLCGDVTHLRKDCPTAMDKKEGTSIKLQTLDSTEHLEEIEQNMNKPTQETTKKPKKIKF